MIDIDDGILNFEMRSHYQTLTVALSNGLLRAVHILNNDGRYRGMLISAPLGENFCIGADLEKLYKDYCAGSLMLTVDDIILAQTAYMSIKYSPKPIIAVPCGKALGGGAELCLSASKIVASENLYIGLVEAKIGLLPAAGGCKELLLRFYEYENCDVNKASIRAFETISRSIVSSSAYDAKTIGFLRPDDIIEADSADLIKCGKEAAIELVANGYRANDRAKVCLAPRSVYCDIVSGLDSARSSGMVSEHEYYVGKRIAQLITNKDGECMIEIYEDEILERERMAFLELAMNEKCHEKVRCILGACN